MTALAGTSADLYIASGAGVTFTTEAVADTGDHQNYRQTGTPAHRYWDDTSALTVEISTNGGGSWSTAKPTTYTVQYCGGLITFTTIDATRTARATGKYLTISKVGLAHQWEANPSAAIVDVTVFGDAWHEKLVTLKDASAKASHYYVDAAFLNLLGARFVLVLYINFSVGSRMEGFAILKTPAAKVSVDGVVEEELEFEIAGQLFYLAS
jgi:hypothetical protein